MKEKTKRPLIRFKGFTEDWEQRKFSEVIKSHSFRSFLVEPVELGNYEVIQQGDNPVVGYSDGEPFESYEDVTLFGDHTVSLYKPMSPFFVATDGVKILSGEGFDGRYFYSTLERYKPESQGYKRHFSILKKEYVSYTRNKKEQLQVGEYFKNIDNLITLHQRKLEYLEVLKKTFLNKMFPKNEEIKPEYRFSGFTDDWEQRKLSELAQTYVGGGTPSTKIAEYWGGDIPWIQSSDILINDVHSVNYNKKITKKALENSSAKFIPAGSLAIITRVGVGKLALVPFDYATSQDFISFVELNENPTYLQYQMYLLLNKLKHTLQGTSIKGITNKELLSNKVKVPINDEQNKIGELFKNIDKTITLHQRKLEEFEKLKKYLLKHMFV